MKHQRGFSIIEIAVVLIVVGMLLMSAVPTMTEWMRNAKLRNQAESVQNGLQQARNEAVRRNRPVSFYLVSNGTATALDNGCTVSATGTSWVVSVRDPGGACAATPTNANGYTYTLSDSGAKGTTQFAGATATSACWAIKSASDCS